MSPSVSSNTANLLLELRTVCSAVAERNLLELLAVVEGIKAVVRLPLNNADWPVLVDYCEKLGLEIAHSSFKIATVRTTPLGDRFTINVPWSDSRGQEFVAYVARTLEAARRAEVIDHSGNNSEIGQLYQYPRCCTEGYLEIERGAYWAEIIVRRTSGSHQSLFSNKLAYLFDGASLFPDYFPCSLSCEETKRLGIAYYSLLRKYGMEDLADSLRERLSRPVLFGDGIAYQFRNASIEDDEMLFERENIELYRWADTTSECLQSSCNLTLETKGPWIRARNGGTKVGVLFLFNADF